MINKLLKFFLLRNTLFLKIILVFTLPAIGMLYFSTVLVYEKIETLGAIKNVQKNIQYSISTQKLIHSLQKERGYSSLSYASNEFKQKLLAQRENTDKIFSEYLDKSLSLNLDTHIKNYIKDIQSRFYKIPSLRENIDKKTINEADFFEKYSSINRLLLDSLYETKPVLFATEFNDRFSYIINLLSLKENISIQRDTIAIILNTNNFNPEILSKLTISYVLEEVNKKQFVLKAKFNELNKFNSEFTNSQEDKILNVKESLKKGIIPTNISIQEWWDLSTSKVDSLEKVYHFVTLQVSKLAKELQTDAYLAQILSLTFLLVSFITLISLLFVLRSIIFNEQKSFNKIKKQQEVYKLLNKTNKFLLKTDNEKVLFNKICRLISENPKMSFGFIYKIKKDNSINLIAQQGELNNIINEKFKKEKNRQNLISKVIETKKNVIVDSYETDTTSFMNDIAEQYDIHSAAAFPIKKFDEITAVLVLYSNESYFFDSEIEILFEKMINDMTHTLEKISYERTRKEQEAELRLASYAFESNEPMIITDEESFIINANNAFCNVMGFSKEEVIGRRPSMFKSKNQNRQFYENMWKTLLGTGSWSGEIYNTKKDKKKIPLRSTITAIKDNEGNITHFLGQYIDISEQINKQKLLEYQATHDNLTGLPNRLLLTDRIEHSISRVIRNNLYGGLIFIDLDNFKEVNDTLGHDIGDRLLVLVANKLKKTIRSEDTIARIGGDEFIILVDSIGQDRDEAKHNMEVLAQKVKLSLNSIIEIDGHKNISTPSIGVTLFNDATVDAKDIIKQADTAMYMAKNKGKNSIEFFN